jgi:hypothetical protein
MFSTQSDNPAAMKRMENLFDSLSPDDKQSFLANHSGFSSSSPVAVSTKNLTAAQAESENDDDSRSPAPAGIAKAAAVRRRQILNERKKKKKPLNAFIAFRCETSQNK